MPSYPGAIVPAAPFQHPVPLPTLGTGVVTITLDQGWLPYLVGAAKVLTAASTWDPPVLSDIETTILAAYDLLQVLSGAVPGTCADQFPTYGSWEFNDMPDVRQNPTNPCQFQIQCPDGTWDTVYDGSLCVTNPAPGGGKTPPPGGGCQDYTLFPKANAITPTPFLVNTGDTLTVTSEMGAGSDGTLDWFCPDGAFFVAGACAGGSGHAGTDPLPTTNHMALILRIGSSFFPLPVGVFTVPGGITNAPAYIQVNDSSLTDNTGEYTVSLSYCNNQSPPPTAWCHVFDFTISPQGFSSWEVNDANGQPQVPAVWTSGVGWVAQNCIPPPSATYEWYFGIGINLGASFAGAGWVAEVKGHMGIHQVTDFFVVGLSNVLSDDSFPGASVDLGQPASNADFDETGTLSGSADQFLKVRYIQYSINAPTTPAFVLKSLKISGTGANPFGPSNC